MKRITLLFAIIVGIFMVGVPAQGHEGHKHVKAQASAFDCQEWASHDPAHPNAPDSYRTYGCSPVYRDGQVLVNQKWVVGTGKYSNTIHSTKLRRECIGGMVLGYCLQWRMSVLSHYHS